VIVILTKIIASLFKSVRRDAGGGLQPRLKRLDALIAFETLSLQPRLKRLILQLSLKDHRRNMPAFGYIAPFGCFI
jgi:hypothetical protein